MLKGYRVLDCSGPLGWLAGRILGELGADVLKVEAPTTDRTDPAWRAANVNKRLQLLDLDEAGNREALHALLAAADVLLCSYTPGTPAAALYDEVTLRACNPELITVAITPFGEVGPRAGWRASDIELMAAGGAMSLTGEPGATPYRVSVPQSPPWTGAQAAVGALVALNYRTATGRGQRVGVSAQAGVITALAHAPAFWDINRVNPQRAGTFMTGRSVHGARYRVFWPCRDGYLNFILYGGVAGRRTNEALVAWMREAQHELGALGEVTWSAFDPTRLTQAEVDALEAPILGFFAGIGKREFLAEAHRRSMLGYPVSTVDDIAADDQLAARDFWQEIRAADGTVERHCGGFVIVDGERLSAAPPEQSAWDKVPERAAEARTPPPAGATGTPPRRLSTLPEALSGLRVVEFGAYAAGPHIGKMLANFGATVIHVESRGRPDGFRMQYPPYPDGKPGLNRSGCFSLYNDSKFAVTVDIKKPEGLALARRLAGWADLVIENMRPGVMARIGLGYAELARDNPGLVMLSTCNMGQTGPRADTPGFGSQLSAFAGFCGLTGEPDGPPMLLYGPYIDFVASNLGATAVLAALERQRRTGRGAYIDQSQYEGGLLFLAGALLDYHTRGRIAGRDANRDPEAAPHGSYACADGAWLVLSCWSDSEFARLAACLGDAALQAPRFASAAQRRAQHADLDAALAGWCAGRDAGDAASLLQAAGVHAYPVNTMADLFSDPQLRTRGTWRTRQHTEMGEQAYLFPPFDLALTPGDIKASAPLLGAHNELVFKDLLGLDEQEYADYAAAGAFD